MNATEENSNWDDEVWMDVYLQLCGKTAMKQVQQMIEKMRKNMRKHLTLAELPGCLVGFFNKKEQLGVGIVVQVLSPELSTLHLSILLGDKPLDMKVKKVAGDGSLWITNNTQFPYCQFLSGEDD